MCLMIWQNSELVLILLKELQQLLITLSLSHKVFGKVMTSVLEQLQNILKHNVKTLE